MRYLFLIVGVCILVLGVSQAQTTNAGRTGSISGGAQQVPVGQIFRNFVFPDYENGQLKATLSASQAEGITQNRAETLNLVIKLYDGATQKPTTTITSPKADLLLADHKMRTKNTVRVERSDMVATAQTCDFDQLNKKYTMRINVRVVLKNFDAGAVTKPPSTPDTSPKSAPAPQPAPSSSVNPNASILDSPGSFSDTNSPPVQPANDNH